MPGSRCSTRIYPAPGNQPRGTGSSAAEDPNEEFVLVEFASSDDAKVARERLRRIAHTAAVVGPSVGRAV